MPILPLKIPPGVYKNGTEYQARGRWADADLVRWHEGSMRPIGGWRKHTSTAVTGKARGFLAWMASGNDREVALGTASKLYAMGEDSTLYDITPSGLVVGSENAVAATGYGSQLYGAHNYGTARPTTTQYSPATTWSLDNWGERLVACSTKDGKLYEWALVNTTAAAVITNAPTSCNALIVTSERFLMALGASGNNRLVKWCDQENNTSWTASATTQAGDIELTTDGSIETAVRVRGQTLILTTTDAHTATYIGPPFVFSFERAGNACGIIGPKAVATMDTFAVWMGLKSFFLFDGYTKEVDSDVAEYVFNDLNYDQRSKIYAVVNSRFGEVWWFYPSDGSLECDRYVSWNWTENHWNIGALSRTAGVDASVYTTPFFVGTDGYIYEHETGFTYDSRIPYAESGPMQIGDGDTVTSVTGMIPDEKTLGDVQARFKTRFHPTDTERDYGPFTMKNPTSFRLTGRQITIKVESARDTDWRVGEMRVQAVSGGRR